MGIRAELHWCGIHTWRSLQRHLVGGILNATVGSMLSVWGEIAARLVQVCITPQVMKGAIKSYAWGRGRVRRPSSASSSADPVNLKLGLCSRTCQHLTGDLGEVISLL